jgi:hypothetical protein
LIFICDELWEQASFRPIRIERHVILRFHVKTIVLQNPVLNLIKLVLVDGLGLEYWSPIASFKKVWLVKILVTLDAW